MLRSSSSAATASLSRRKGARAGATTPVFVLVILMGLVAAAVVLIVLYVQSAKAVSLGSDGSAHAAAAVAAAASHGNQPPLDDDNKNDEMNTNEPMLEEKVGDDDDTEELQQQHPRHAREGTLVLTTEVGDLRIRLRPDLSAESVDYIHAVVDSTEPCQRCTFYRAEKPGILQGVMKSAQIPVPMHKGACPPGSETVENSCPAWDLSCGCHGPVMERGMVAWAAGKTGPDFFIDDYRKPALWWGTQHTVFGQIQDTPSLEVMDTIWTLPSSKKGGMTMLDVPIKFTMRIE